MARNKSKENANLKQSTAAVEDTKVKYKRKTVSYNSEGGELLYGKDFYIFMLIGLGLIILGFILMAGGHQDPNEWNADEIYSFRRTTLAPIVMIAGLVVEIYAIFKK